MNKTRFRNYIAIIAVMLAALLLGACSGIGAQATATPEPVTVQDSSPVVSATGKVVPQYYSELNLRMAGQVAEVLVEEGDVVKTGDVLMRLEGVEDMTAAISAAQYEIAAAEKALDDLDISASDTANQTLQLIAQRERELRDARYQLDNFTPPREQASMAAEEAVQWAKARLDEAWQAFAPYRYYPENDSTREDRKDDYDEAQADYNAAIKRLEYETALKTAQSNLADAQEDYAMFSQGADPKDVAVAQARLANAKAALAAAESKLDDLELRAPFDGTASDVNARVGEFVQPGTPGASVVTLADLDHLQVETTDLNEIDAARVAVGSPVTITFDALPGVTVTGTVKSIAPKASEGSGVNYTAVILLDEMPELLRWGMTAFVDIAVGD